MSGNRFLLDQMLDVDVASVLVAGGDDVVRVSELGMARSADDEILKKAGALGRVLVTLDEHFGDWVVLPLGNHTGVIRIRTNPATTEGILGVLVPFLQEFRGRSFQNTLAIVSKHRVRWIRTGE